MSFCLTGEYCEHTLAMRNDAFEFDAAETHHVRHLVGGAAVRRVRWTLRMEEHGLPQQMGAVGAERVDGQGHAGEARVGDMEIGCGAPDALVTQKHLDSAEIRSELEQVSREAVTEDVGCDALGDARDSRFTNRRRRDEVLPTPVSPAPTPPPNVQRGLDVRAA